MVIRRIQFAKCTRCGDEVAADKLFPDNDGRKLCERCYDQWMRGMARKEVYGDSGRTSEIVVDDELGIVAWF